MLGKLGLELLGGYAGALEAMHARSSERRIHRFRVNAKKLRTLLHLLELLAPGAKGPKAAVKRSRALFQAAGPLREAQVSARVVAGLDGVKKSAKASYAKRLAAQERRALKALEEQARKLKDGDVKRFQDHLAEATQGSTLAWERRIALRYVDTELSEARRLLEEQDPGDVLHDARKHIKNAWHTLRLLHGGGFLDKARMRTMERMAPLQEALGHWQDMTVLLEDLRKWKDGGEARKALRHAVRDRLELNQRELLQVLPKVLGGAAGKVRS